jgi:hypothetical protein
MQGGRFEEGNPKIVRLDKIDGIEVEWKSCVWNKTRTFPNWSLSEYNISNSASLSINFRRQFFQIARNLSISISSLVVSIRKLLRDFGRSQGFNCELGQDCTESVKSPLRAFDRSSHHKLTSPTHQHSCSSVVHTLRLSNCALT